VTSSWFFLSTPNYDARSTTHQKSTLPAHAVRCCYHPSFVHQSPATKVTPSPRDGHQPWEFSWLRRFSTNNTSFTAPLSPTRNIRHWSHRYINRIYASLSPWWGIYELIPSVSGVRFAWLPITKFNFFVSHKLQ